jgi:hypothetical protein
LRIESGPQAALLPILALAGQNGKAARTRWAYPGRTKGGTRVFEGVAFRVPRVPIWE